MTTLIRKIGKACFRVLGYYPDNIYGYKFKLDPYHIGFWREAARGGWEPQTYQIMSQFLNADTVYCDLGAWIGPTVIFAAKKCRRVVCFEPDPVAYRYLCWNIELNELKNVSPFNVALAAKSGMQKMASFGGHLGDSMTSLLANSKEPDGVDVLTLTWHDVMAITRIDKIDFLKIDIEGGEFSLVPTLKEYLSQYRPIVYLSTHPQFLDAGLRQENMHQIMDVMGMYKKCLDENLKPVGVDELTSVSAVNSRRSFLFMD